MTGLSPAASSSRRLLSLASHSGESPYLLGVTPNADDATGGGSRHDDSDGDESRHAEVTDGATPEYDDAAGEGSRHAEVTVDAPGEGSRHDIASDGVGFEYAFEASVRATPNPLDASLAGPR